MSIIASGTWWRLEDDGTLYIYCVGDMPNYTSSTIPWYDYRAQITSATIANGVTSIGNLAFYNCAVLANVTIPDGVTNIGSYAFEYCYKLASVAIPDGVTNIGSYAFYGCSGLTSVSIPDGITSVGGNAFTSCSKLASVVIPGSVTNFESNIFYNSGLISAVIGNGVASIGSGMFKGCSKLTSVTIPDSVARIKNDAFAYCSNLTDVYYGGTQAQWSAITIDSNNTPLTNAAIHYNYAPPTYTVTFDANGGTGNMSAQTFAAGTAQALTPNAFTRSGYTFGGWNTAADGSGTNYADGATYTATSNVTLYAQWTQATLSSIAVTTPPTTTAYTVGDTFDSSGMTVTATYSDNTTAAVSGYSVSPSGALTVNDSTVTISYTEGGTTKTATVAITVTEATPEPTPTPTAIPKITYTGQSKVIIRLVQTVNALIDRGGRMSLLISKTISENGTYSADSENALGYSTVTVNVSPGLVAPSASDVDTGYVSGGNWATGGTDYYSDVYAVTANKPYLVTLGGTVGTQFNAMFSETNTATATAAVNGTEIVSTSSPAAYACALYTPSTNGYITVTKDNAGTVDIETYVFDVQALIGGGNNDNGS